MKTPAKRTTGNEERSNASNLSNSSAGTASTQLARSSPGSKEQSSMQDMANNSPRVKQLKALQDMADSSHSPIQRFPFRSRFVRGTLRKRKILKREFIRQIKPKSGNLRPSLGWNLMENLYSPNWFAKGVFKAMNFAMYMERQPITDEHNQVLHNSLINNEKGVLDTLIAENPHVIKSKGYTPVYLLGKYLIHQPLEYYLRERKDKID